MPLLHLDPANHRRHSYERSGETRQFYVLPYEGRFIWGATAGILVSLSDAPGLMPPGPDPRLAAAAWLRASATRRVLWALQAGGRPARFVGGCVRDALLGPGLRPISTSPRPSRPTGHGLLEAPA